jgi:hypothetical protein
MVSPRSAKKTTLQVQQLEERCTPAIVGILDNGAGTLAAYNPNLPSASLGTPIPTLSPGGQPVVAMDLRPGTSLLYGIGVNPGGPSDVGTLLSLDLSKGNAVWNPVPTIGAQIQLFNGVLGGGGSTVVDTAWNPSTGHLQIIDEAGDSYEYNPTTAAVTQDAFINRALAGIAYANGTLYGYAEGSGGGADAIVTVNTFTGGTTVVNTIHSFGFNISANDYEFVGLAGDGAGHIYANLDVSGSNELWLLGLASGSESTLLGQFAGNPNVRDIAFVPDSVLTGAQATGATLVHPGQHSAVTKVRLEFNGALNPATAELASNYLLQTTRGTGKHRHKVTVSPNSIVYNPADDSVTLAFSARPSDRAVTVTVLGSNAVFTLALPHHP